MPDEVQSAAHQSQSRSVLWGTVRRIPAGMRISLHLQKENGIEVLAKWILEATDTAGLIGAVHNKKVANTIYSALITQRPVQPATPDPIDEDDTAREYLKIGRQLMDRRTIVDMDRAIASLEAAVRSAPQSVSAWSTLSAARLGRNYLGSSQHFT